MKLATLLLASIALIICGCAGSGGGSAGIATGFYRGTVSADGSALLLPGDGDIVMDVQDNGDFYAVGQVGDMRVIFVKSVDGDYLKVQGNVFPGQIEESGSGGSLKFRFKYFEGTAAFGVSHLSQLPTLGNQTAVPQSGFYSGDMFLLVDGHVREFGTVYGNVDESGNYTLRTSGGGHFTNGGSFGGTFEPNGIVPNGAFGSGGTVYVQELPSHFSNDGTVLTIRHDFVPLDTSAICWMTLRRDWPRSGLK